MSAQRPPPPPEEATTIYQEGPPPGLPPPGETPPDRSLWPWLLVLALLVLGGLAAVYFLTRGDDGNGGGTTGGSPQSGTVAIVRVPDVVGMKRELAVARLDRAGFQAQVRDEASDRPVGTVIDQNPQAGAKLSEGGLVGLTVSSGNSRAVVPNVVGLSAGEAVRVLDSVGLHAVTKRTFSDRRAGIVVAQKPGEGGRVARGGSVQLTVSKGPREVQVPNVVGLQRAAAERRLRAAGLSPSAFEVPSAQQAGVVVAENPQAGASAAHGSTVRINISRGTGTGGGTTQRSATTVPDVVGEDEQIARSDLEGRGFVVKVVRRDTSDQSQDGVVLQQSPKAGAKAAAGATVTIAVGRFTG